MAGRGNMPRSLARHPGMDQLPPIELLERRLAGQHEELQRLAMNNQRLGATHVALREELAGTQQELQRIHAEMDGLRQELLRARNAFECEKAANNEQMHQMQAMENNLLSMAREVEKLRAQLATTNKKVHGAYGAAYNDVDAPFHSTGPNMYGDGYGSSQMPINAASVATYGAGPVAGHGGYDVPRGGGSQMPVAPVNSNPYGAGFTPARGGYDMPRSGTTQARR